MQTIVFASNCNEQFAVFDISFYLSVQHLGDWHNMHSDIELNPNLIRTNEPQGAFPHLSERPPSSCREPPMAPFSQMTGLRGGVRLSLGTRCPQLSGARPRASRTVRWERVRLSGARQDEGRLALRARSRSRHRGVRSRLTGAILSTVDVH